MEKIKDYKSQHEFHIFVASTYSDLQKLRKEKKKSDFSELLLKDLPQVKRYITRRLNRALSKGNLPSGKYSPDDFLDQLFIEVHDRFDEVKDNNDLYPWLFKITDALLEDTLVEEEFNAIFFENIEDFSKPEWDEMEEEFSTDGDGDLLMLDELDDSSYNHNDYVLNHVFVENDKNQMISKLDEKLGRENVRKHASMVLHHLPFPMRTVFELATQYHFNVEQIAIIRGQSLAEVQQLLENARKSLEVSFLNRYVE